MHQISISLPVPCQESWTTMVPTGPGRHCSSCQDIVVDFTCMTDGEVVAFLQQYPGITCGRFSEYQVSRPLLAAAQPVAGWRRWWGATVALLSFGSLFGPKAQGQANQNFYSSGPMPTISAASSADNPTVATTPASNKLAIGVTSTKNNELPDSIFLVKGTVRNRWGIRKSGARVSLHGVHDTTDAQGRFQLLIPKSRLENFARLRVYYRSPGEEGHVLMAKVDFDSARTRPYHITLKKPVLIISGKFR